MSSAGRSSFSCSSCRTFFDMYSYKPIQLSCGHSICQSCIASELALRGVTCPLDSRSSSQSSCVPSVYGEVMGMNMTKSVSDSVEQMKRQCDKQLTDLHTTFDSLRSQLEARKFVLRAEASALASKDIQMREELLEAALQLKQREKECGCVLPTKEKKHLADKVASLCRDRFRLSCIFDEANASRFISSIGMEQPEMVRSTPFECGSFTNVTYWMLPPCCYRNYCCVKCHNLKEDHVWQYANRMICIFCGREQEYRKLPNKCMYCQQEHSGVVIKELP